MKSDSNPVPENNIPRRSFLKGTSAAAASVAIMLTTDAKLKSQQIGFVENPGGGPGDTGHVYMYMEE